MADLLVVASKVKKYIKEKSAMNTASSTLDALSNLIKKACDEAIERAKREGRKTVMDRDFPNGGGACCA